MSIGPNFSGSQDVGSWEAVRVWCHNGLQFPRETTTETNKGNIRIISTSRH
jgi:hypothetical protein